jgi:hypothetical protein
VIEERKTMSRRIVAIVLLLSLPASVAGGEVSGLGEIGGAIAFAALAFGAVRMPGFFSSVFRGGVAGGIAGIAVLGVGMRLAMRLVAVADPVRVPEFTLEGTLFLVLIFGGVFGAITGVWARASADALERPAWAQALAFASVAAMLAGDSEIRSEFVELGSGPLANVPMFTAVVLAYAIVFHRLSVWRRVEAVAPDAVEPAVS